jgi:hypothetical protein
MPTLIINESNYEQAQTQNLERILQQGDTVYPGCLPTKLSAPRPPLIIAAEELIAPIPRDQWKKLIEENQGSFLQDLKGDRLPPHDQGTTNYCWAHGSVRAVELIDLYQTDQPCLLSAESVAVPLTGGRNRGGTPDEALDRLISHGACKQDRWPVNSRDLSYWNAPTAAEAQNHRVLRWLLVRSWEMQVTLAILRFPVAAGLSWWGHLVCQHTPIILPNGEVGIGADNSWGPDYGENGYFVLDEKRGTADLGCFAPLTDTWLSRFEK